MQCSKGAEFDAAGETLGYDPSSRGIAGAFVSAFHEYLSRELKHSSEETYYSRGPNVNESWDQSHKAAGGGSQALRKAYVGGDLADAIRKNQRLRVLCQCPVRSGNTVLYHRI